MSTIRTAQFVWPGGVGIVMERYRLNSDRAFALLVRLSQGGNVRLRAVAARIVDQANADAQT